MQPQIRGGGMLPPPIYRSAEPLSPHDSRAVVRGIASGGTGDSRPMAVPGPTCVSGPGGGGAGPYSRGLAPPNRPLQVLNPNMLNPNAQTGFSPTPTPLQHQQPAQQIRGQQPVLAQQPLVPTQLSPAVPPSSLQGQQPSTGLAVTPAGQQQQPQLQQQQQQQPMQPMQVSQQQPQSQALQQLQQQQQPVQPVQQQQQQQLQSTGVSYAGQQPHNSLAYGQAGYGRMRGNLYGGRGLYGAQTGTYGTGGYGYGSGIYGSASSYGSSYGSSLGGNMHGQGLPGQQLQPMEEPLTVLGSLHAAATNLALFGEGMTGVSGGAAKYVIAPAQRATEAATVALAAMAVATTPVPGWRRRLVYGDDDECMNGDGNGGGSSSGTRANETGSMEAAWSEIADSTGATTRAESALSSSSQSQHEGVEVTRPQCNLPLASSRRQVRSWGPAIHWALSLAVYLLFQRALQWVRMRRQRTSRVAGETWLKMLREALQTTLRAVATGGGSRRPIQLPGAE